MRRGGVEMVTLKTCIHKQGKTDYARERRGRKKKRLKQKRGKGKRLRCLDK